MVSKTILSIINEAFPCDPTRENGVQESPQTFLNPEIINNFSAENIQSVSGGYSKSFFLRKRAASSAIVGTFDDSNKKSP